METPRATHRAAWWIGAGVLTGLVVAVAFGLSTVLTDFADRQLGLYTNYEAADQP